MFGKIKLLASRTLLICGFLLFTNAVTHNVFAQENNDVQISGVVKASGIAPLLGATFDFGSGNKLRTLGFFSVNTYNSNDNFFLDLSYLRNADWTDVEAVETYWGINMHLQFEDPTIGPGALVGTAYNLNDHFAIFGEAGFNVFIFDEGNRATIGLLNSGVGIKVSF